MMVCHCVLAGTKACENCNNRRLYYNNYDTSTNKFTYEKVFHVDNIPENIIVDEKLNIISDLNKHISDLQEENKLLKQKLQELEQ